MQSASSGSSADSNVGRPDWSNPQTPSTTLNILCVTIPIIGPGEAAGGIAVDVADSGGTVNRDLVFSAGRPHVPFGAGLRPCTTVRRDDDTTSGGIRSAYPIRENGRRLIHEEHEAHKGHKENPNSLRRIASVGGAALRAVAGVRSPESQTAHAAIRRLAIQLTSLQSTPAGGWRRHQRGNR